jgi:hypothetical protein
MEGGESDEKKKEKIRGNVYPCMRECEWKLMKRVGVSERVFECWMELVFAQTIFTSYMQKTSTLLDVDFSPCFWMFSSGAFYDRKKIIIFVLQKTDIKCVATEALNNFLLSEHFWSMNIELQDLFIIV